MANASIRFRRGTAAEWTSRNPILIRGEPGFESDTNAFKIGDGRSQWSSLPYFVDQDVVEEMIVSGGDDDGPSLVLLYENAKV